MMSMQYLPYKRNKTNQYYFLKKKMKTIEIKRKEMEQSQNYD